MIREDFEIYLKLMGGKMVYDATSMTHRVCRPLPGGRVVTALVPDCESPEVLDTIIAELASYN